ncbi:LmeA family phospholipid-binding protein [Streptomyces lydicus]|uniref:LmeA family phospholipid-binding protein n=1 Tax=Streptomyces lydicus TaxID=47763 RepID=UPI003795D8F4
MVAMLSNEPSADSEARVPASRAPQDGPAWDNQGPAEPSAPGGEEPDASSTQGNTVGVDSGTDTASATVIDTAVTDNGTDSGPRADGGTSAAGTATATAADSGTGSATATGADTRVAGAAGATTAADAGTDNTISGDGKEHPRTGRKPRRIVRRTAKVVLALAVVLAILALGDRWAVLYAENVAAQQVQKALKLRAEPEVHIDSFPFIGQVLAGNIDHVEVNVPDVDAGPVSVAQVKGTVDDIRIVGSLPSSVKGAVLSRVRGDVLLDFKDLNREVGASQIHLVPGPEKNTVLAGGDLPVGDKQAQIRGRAQLQRTGDRGLRMTVQDTRVVVPGLLTYVPGKGGGLQLTAPVADKMDEGELQQATGKHVLPQQMMKGRALDTLVDHPSLLKPTGIDPSLIQGLQKLREPKVAQQMEFSAQLPDNLPGDIRLRDISVTKTGIRAQLTGLDVPVGQVGSAKSGQPAS